MKASDTRPTLDAAADSHTRLRTRPNARACHRGHPHPAEIGAWLAVTRVPLPDLNLPLDSSVRALGTEGWLRLRDAGRLSEAVEWTDRAVAAGRVGVSTSRPRAVVAGQDAAASSQWSGPGRWTRHVGRLQCAGGEEAGFVEYLLSLRERYRNPPALRAALDAAGLPPSS